VPFRKDDGSARAAALRSWLGRNPSAAGKRSWAKRSPELKAQHLKALLNISPEEQRARSQRAVRAAMQLRADPNYAAELAMAIEVAKRTEAAKERGEPSPIFFRQVLYKPMMPSFVKNPGIGARRRIRRAERKAAAKLQAELQNQNSSEMSADIKPDARLETKSSDASK
jgi:hypothetical protein